MAIRKVGALWLKDSKKGNKYMSGELQLEGRNGPRIRILVFKNTKKDKPKDPDYTVNVSEDDDQAQKENTDGDQPDTDDRSGLPF